MLANNRLAFNLLSKNYILNEFHCLKLPPTLFTKFQIKLLVGGLNQFHLQIASV